MSWKNHSSISEFLLLGLPIQPEQQKMFFILFLGMYLTTVLGNLLIILLIRLDSRLHTPMYFFLSHLAFTDVSFSSVIVPKMLMDMQTNHQRIPYVGCIAQMYFFIFFSDLDSFLITSMAYDHYDAICHPLHYTTVMREGLCTLLVAVSWFLSCASLHPHTFLLTRLSFCNDNKIPYFFCDLAALLKLSSNIFLSELVMVTVGVVVITLPFICILVSYGYTGATILSKPLTKRFAKLHPHVVPTSLWYLYIMGQYLGSTFSENLAIPMTRTSLYLSCTQWSHPYLTPLSIALGTDIKQALRKLFRRVIFFSW